MRVFRAAVAAGVLASMLAVGPAAVAADARPAAGKVRVFVTTVSDTKSKIVVTGAIGDYGIGTSIDKNGKVDANGNYEKVVLKQGSLLVNATAFNQKLNKSKPTINKQTCSLSLSGSGGGSFVSGTGLYRGIKGKLTLTATFAFVAKRFTSGPKKGQCNLSGNSQPVAQYTAITATGTVSFS